ncbi:hypothetical protein ACO0K7_01950 [Undibacterium sp. Ji67W]|uniref:hypothetical protein n=1 Tax=Undibacterium sp. Ji67W TaxID=3413042 RepID=UPI003BF41DAB
MSIGDEIQTRLSAMGIQCSGAIVRGEHGERHFLVHVPVKRNDENKQVPSNKKLHDAKSEFAENGIEIEFLLHDEFGKDIEAGLRATLLHSHGDSIRNSFLSMYNDIATVWIDPKKVLDDEELKKIRIESERYLAKFEIERVSFSLTTGQNLPTILVCLKTIRTLAPVSVKSLSESLILSGFSIPSEDWLKRRLDVIRKDGKIFFRRDDDTYVLSLKSLENLGTGRGRSSPDIKRLLALARRG